MEVLERAGYSAYLVGGAVRDLLLGRAPADLDIATNAKPEIVKSLFDRTVDTGIRHGTVSVRVRDQWMEVTTFRAEGPYADGRRPDYVEFVDDVVADLARRDFTINAMALDRSGRLVDPFGGRQDLARRLLRAVGDPVERFREDGLRLVRAVRFVVQLSLACDPATERALVEQVDAIRPIALERIGRELERLACAPWHEHLDWLASLPLWRQRGEPLAWLEQGFAWLAARRPFSLAPPPGWPSVALWFVGLDEDAPLCGKRFAESLAYGKDVAHSVERAVRLVRAWLGGADATSPLMLYEAGYDAAVMAARMIAFLTCGDLFERARWKRAICNQPLWDRADLALPARDLMDMGARGKEIGEYQQALVKAVLSGKMKNRREDLRRLVMAWRKEDDGHGLGGQPGARSAD
ncbi:tRNA cytidylyltransferase [Alicyclobacillus vulcanalis]|uniref:tRNA nucleotidyltransferase (CCA-adding enzyme) n=1 Tax=Alicyclobacillus vulcanalis TaxID=252246 RepID=A0A1N7NER0_9BACL|nr:tRNA cytidylyltransferase [Alicyclobacillus vulcanalis]SIS96721.1 tRNA nucleotidyltransferase (CCA-adding enzyme) [Alicyclobacillus vulcanalis]